MGQKTVDAKCKPTFPAVLVFISLGEETVDMTFDMYDQMTFDMIGCMTFDIYIQMTSDI